MEVVRRPKFLPQKKVALQISILVDFEDALKNTIVNMDRDSAIQLLEKFMSVIESLRSKL